MKGIIEGGRVMSSQPILNKYISKGLRALLVVDGYPSNVI